MENLSKIKADLIGKIVKVKTGDEMFKVCDVVLSNDGKIINVYLDVIHNGKTEDSPIKQFIDYKLFNDYLEFVG